MQKILTIFLVLATMAGYAAPMKLEPAQQKKMNTFFSNFSEAYVESFKADALTDDVMKNFALRHLYINKFKALTKSKDGTSVLAAVEQVDTAAMKFFGKKLQKHAEMTYAIPLADGEMFTFSQLDTLEDLGNDSFKAEGTIYTTGSGGTPDVHGNPEAWKKAGEEVDASGKFSALIKAEGERYILVEYTLTDGGIAEPKTDTASATPAAAANDQTSDKAVTH